MRTIRENLEEAIDLLKTNLVVNHIKACELVYLDLSSIKGFDTDALGVLAYYQTYLIEKHQQISRVGIWVKIRGFFRAKALKYKITNLINKCDVKSFGDGDKYIKEMCMLIRKAI